jgi:uncharacterized protein YkwD
MHMKGFQKLLIVAGLLLGCTLGTTLLFPAGSSAATVFPNGSNQALPNNASARQNGPAVVGAADVYLPLVIKSTPPPTPTPSFTPTPTAPACLTHNGDFEQQLYDLINDIRAENGLVALTENYSLEVSAGAHSDDMAVNHFIDHTGSDGSTFWERAVRAGYTGRWGGEIIMTANSPQAAVNWWMSDGPHRDMILSDTNDFGAGYAHCTAGYFTVDFGHR